MTPGSTPSPRSPGCSVFPAAPSTGTSTKPQSVPDPTPRRQQRHRLRPFRCPHPRLIGPSTSAPVTPRQHPDHPGRARAAGTNPPRGRKPPRNAPTWPSPGSAPIPTDPDSSSPDNTAATANPTTPCSTSPAQCVVMDPSSPATSPPPRPTPVPHRNPCSNGWPPTAGNSPRSCCVPTTYPRHIYPHDDRWGAGRTGQLADPASGETVGADRENDHGTCCTRCPTATSASTRPPACTSAPRHDAHRGGGWSTWCSIGDFGHFLAAAAGGVGGAGTVRRCALGDGDRAPSGGVDAAVDLAFTERHDASSMWWFYFHHER